ncbi:hypothetical protein BDN72DRAFT_855598 [Pluteus cervinus]|uniref:Uncharacterized protein n=1 Tax=Pluteus cervinus TaxID=181527 RepID=A0ACD3B2H8_9AGAR|nr:hypothetical protein BDN72DRAFT_855598 [Pluteus cervinus]
MLVCIRRWRRKRSTREKNRNKDGKLPGGWKERSTLWRCYGLEKKGSGGHSSFPNLNGKEYHANSKQVDRTWCTCYVQTLEDEPSKRFLELEYIEGGIFGQCLMEIGCLSVFEEVAEYDPLALQVEWNAQRVQPSACSSEIEELILKIRRAPENAEK